METILITAIDHRHRRDGIRVASCISSKDSFADICFANFNAFEAPCWHTKVFPKGRSKFNVRYAKTTLLLVAAKKLLTS